MKGRGAISAPLFPFGGSMLQIDRVQCLSGPYSQFTPDLFNYWIEWHHTLARLTYRSYDALLKYASADNRFEENHPDLVDGE